MERANQFEYAWSEELLKGAEPRWEVLKNKGNASFLDGNFLVAERCYEDALSIALQPMPQIKTLIFIAKRRPTSSLALFIDAQLLLLLLPYLPKWIVQRENVTIPITAYLPSYVVRSMSDRGAAACKKDGIVTFELCEPNKAAAICYTNLAVMQLKRDDSDKSYPDSNDSDNDSDESSYPHCVNALVNAN
jgi:hypothetical protein